MVDAIATEEDLRLAREVTNAQQDLARATSDAERRVARIALIRKAKEIIDAVLRDLPGGRLTAILDMVVDEILDDVEEATE